MEKLAHYQILFTILLFFSVLATQAQSTYSISGHVKNTDNEPLEGASVAIYETQTGQITDKDGYFQFTNLPEGEYHLHISYLGYKCVDEDVKIRSGNQYIAIRMQSLPVEISDVEVIENTTTQRRHAQTVSVEIVDEDFIRRHAGGSLMNTLERLPGVASVSIGSSFSKPVVRGLAFNRVVVAENGIKQEGQQWGADHGLELDQYNIENLEIIKGPASLIYGSDAIGGVVAVQPPAIPATHSLKADVQFNAKSVNELLGISAGISGRSDKWFFRSRVTLQDYADYKVPAETAVYNTYTLEIDRALKNTAGKEQNFSASGGYFSRDFTSTLTVSNVRHKIGFYADAHGAELINFNFINYEKSRRDVHQPFQEVNHFKVISNTKWQQDNHSLAVDAGFQYNFRQEIAPAHVHGNQPQPTDNVELEFGLSTYSLNTRYKHRWSKLLETTAGTNFQYQQNSIGGYTFLIPAYQRSIAGVSFFQNFNITARWKIKSGVRFDYGYLKTERYVENWLTNGEYKQRSPGLEKKFTNFSWGVGTTYGMGELTHLKLNIGKSFRMPIAAELGANGMHHGTFRFEQGDSTITPEHAYQVDVTYEYENPAIFGGSDALFFSLTPFVNYFTNFIFLRPSGEFNDEFGVGQIYRYTQSEALRIGGEIQLKYHFLEQFDFHLNGEYIYATNLEANYPVPFTPPASLIADFQYSLKSWRWHKTTTLGIAAQMVAAQNRVARNEPPTPAYELFHFSANTQLLLGNQPVEIGFQIQNLLNTNYLNHLSFYRLLEIPEAGRNYQLHIKLPIEIR